MPEDEEGLLSYQLYRRRKLPHYQPGGATIFDTFCLAGAMPLEALQMMQEAQACARQRATSQPPDAHQKERDYEEHKRLFARWDCLMHETKRGPFWLRDPRVAALVVESIRYLDGRVYDLACFCVMPNHVHIVFTPRLNPEAENEYYSLSRIFHSLKGFTGKHGNILLKRHGDFWHAEGYDHVVRDSGEFDRITAYVLNNPVKAGLVSRWEDWPWSGVKGPDGNESVVVGFT